jgi:predicted DNA-binding transcriptional regulator AlpA
LRAFKSGLLYHRLKRLHHHKILWRQTTTTKGKNMKSSITVQPAFSSIDLVDYFGVDRQTIYRMRIDSRLPSSFIFGKRIRRWSLSELVTHSDELQQALAPFIQAPPHPANDK